MKKKVKFSRWRRAEKLLRRAWVTSVELVNGIDAVSPPKARSEMRNRGGVLRARRRRGTDLLEYRAVRTSR
jgi:hypothetical protein